MLLGKEAESEASVGGKPGIRVSIQEYPTGLVPQGAGGDSGAERKSHPLRYSLSLIFQAAVEFPPRAI
jgi:hypothetical protein